MTQIRRTASAVITFFAVTMIMSVCVFAGNVNVTFITPTATVVKTVPQGTDMTYQGPTDVNVAGYAFCGWNVSLKNVQKDTVAQAVYVKSGTQSQSTAVCDTYHNLPTGVLSYSTANKDTIPSATANLKTAATPMAAPCTLTAAQTIALNPTGIAGKTCVVKWYNGSTGELWKTDVVAYGTTLAQPASPCIAGYEFTGWDGSWTNITADRNIIACYYKVYHVYYQCSKCGAILGDKYIRVTDSIAASTSDISLYQHGSFVKWDDPVYSSDGCTVLMVAEMQ